MKLLTHEQAKAIALRNDMPICKCGCESPTRQVMQFYWDLVKALVDLNEEKNDD